MRFRKKPVVLEEPCEHGRAYECSAVTHGLSGRYCPGGTRKAVSGTPIKWCEAHQSLVSDHPEGPDICWFMMFAKGVQEKLGLDTRHLPCDIVDRILIDSGEETE